MQDIAGRLGTIAVALCLRELARRLVAAGATAVAAPSPGEFVIAPAASAARIAAACARPVEFDGELVDVELVPDER